MLRIKREANIYSTAGFEQNLDRELRIIQRHFPPSIMHLYAVPKVIKDAHGAAALEWLSPIGGTITPYTDLDIKAQKSLWEQMANKQRSVAALQDELNRQNRPEDAALLQPLLATPAPEQLYAINGEPVIADWKVPPQDPTIPAAALSTMGTGATAAVPPRGLTRWWLALLLLLLIGMLALLAGWLYRLWPLDVFTNTVNTPAFMQSYACAPPAATQKPPEFTVILDTSDSMSLNINTTAADEQWFYEIGHLITYAPRAQRMFSSPSRFDVARPALQSMVKQIHPDIPIRLMSFETCNKVIDHGTFKTGQRNGLHAAIHSLKPEGPTPLALALEQAAKKMDGRTKDGIIVMFIDGEDGCEGNICQVAQDIANKQPRLRVNIVDISGSGLSNCVAEHTGGRVYTSQDTQEISRLLRSSVEEVAANAVCSKEQ